MKFFVTFVDGSNKTIDCDEWIVKADGFIYFQDYNARHDIIKAVALFKKELIASVISDNERIYARPQDCPISDNERIYARPQDCCTPGFDDISCDEWVGYEHQCHKEGCGPDCCCAYRS